MADIESQPAEKGNVVLADKLKVIIQAVTGGSRALTYYDIITLEEVEKMLRKDEAFEPEPDPKSGQGQWKEMARMLSEGNDFYHDIVKQTGEIIGQEAYISDDGSVQDSVLALKVPELVKALKERATTVVPNNQDH